MKLLSTVRAAHHAGIVLETDGRRLILAGPAPDGNLREALAAYKTAIVALLVAEGVGTDDGWGTFEGESAGAIRYVTPPGCCARHACRRLGWCAGALEGRCCGTADKCVGRVRSMEVVGVL